MPPAAPARRARRVLAAAVMSPLGTVGTVVTEGGSENRPPPPQPVFHLGPS